MSRPLIDEDACVACGICVDSCPQGVLDIGAGAVEVTSEDSCIGCGDCLEECPMGAITDIVDD